MLLFSTENEYEEEEDGTVTTTDERPLLLKNTTTTAQQQQPTTTTTTAECNALRIRIEFLEETIRNYRSLPADLLSTFDVNRCGGNCEVLRQNFWDVWSTNASLHGKFENEMLWYKNAIQSRDDHVMELQGVNALLEKGLNHSNAQLFEMRRRGVEWSAEEKEATNEDLEAFFTRKLEDERFLSITMRSRIAELEETLYLKEHESGARQMQINHLLSLSNQLEHAAEVSKMRNKLFDAEKRIQDMDTRLKFTIDNNNNNNAAATTTATATANNNNNNTTSCSSPLQLLKTVADVVVFAPHSSSSNNNNRLILPQVNIEQNDQRLASRFKDFFRLLDVDGPPSSGNLEEHMYDQFLLDQPNRVENKVRSDMFTRDEILQAMHDAVGGSSSSTSTTTKKLLSLAKAHHHHHNNNNSIRICKRDFAACLASLGGKFKRRRGVRFWVNMGMKRKPLFSWDPVVLRAGHVRCINEYHFY
jgi:hypothetical protein